MSASGWQVFVEVPGKAPIELESGEAVIGRSRASAVQIAESTVSRQHAVFVVEPGRVRLKDLGSSNGTYVNGKRVDGSLALADGDRVVVGEAELVIRILAPLQPTEATQRLQIPPLTAPPASATAAEPPVLFRRTPTDVAPVPPPPPAPSADAAGPRATPPPPPMPPPPQSSAAAVAPAAPVTPAPPEAPRVTPITPMAPVAPAKAKGEVLQSIQEIDSVPIPPPVARRAPVAENLAPAGFWLRVAAALLDAIPAVVLAVLSLALSFLVSPKASLLVTPLQLAYGLLIALAMPALRGTTPGKKLLKLAIVSDSTTVGQGLGWGTAFLRLVGHMVCGLTFGLGYLLVAFTAQKQGLHDLIAKTHVVRRRA